MPIVMGVYVFLGGFDLAEHYVIYAARIVLVYLGFQFHRVECFAIDHGAGLSELDE
jgi:hypothetical protein